ncbi:hypothetical protein [Cellulomonas sp. S1-8]|uniref:hypothetical protein n=1 Tax=Cellulomonas sp. S1-8 TaxID=2904790 RepID=UPI002242D065|nr:hypothetical protein [Cellulomonas sp. S1-8]UZN03058.1 hypothetical protein OKX07_18710 [Cellulomonas sp. S1-8]
MNPWAQGRATVDQLIAAGTVERVPADLEAARALVNKSRVHLQSAALLADADVDLAYDALHAANRKALTAVLLAQGLRPTRAGGHIAVYDAVRAQLDPPMGNTLAPYSRIRRARNAGDYLDQLPATGDDVRGDLPLCEAIVDAADRVLGKMPPY